MVNLPATCRQPRRVIVVIVMSMLMLTGFSVLFQNSLMSGFDSLSPVSKKESKDTVVLKVLLPEHEDKLPIVQKEETLEGKKEDNELKGRKNEHLGAKTKDEKLEERKNENLKGKLRDEMLKGKKDNKPKGRKDEETTVKKDSEDVAKEFETRRKVYQKVCSDWEEKTGVRIPGMVRSPFLYPPANFSYCGVPKVGITFWKRIFFFLFNNTNKRSKGKMTSPLDVDRFFVHYNSPGWGSRVDMKGPEKWRVLSKARRVMFSRDPWSRLWSAYVDKFILPDSWMDHGKWLSNMRSRLPAQEAMALKNQSALERRVAESENSPLAFHTKNKTECPDDITFGEFLRYVVMSKNAHWRPVHGVCNPCVYQPHFLGKMETFSRDTDYILKAAGLSHSVKFSMSHSDHVLDELEQLTLYHYDHFRRFRTRFQSCLDNLGVARRLWRAFQLNGYISPDDKFPDVSLRTHLVNLTQPQIESYVVKMVQGAHSARPLSHKEWSALKRRNMVGAYRSVPKELLYEMQEKFQLDFELFQYDQQPKDIFGE